MRLWFARVALMLLCVHLGSVASGSAYTADSYFEYVKSVYNQHEKELSGFLATELETFMRLFPQDDHVAEASYLLAQVYLERGKEHRALAAFFKTLYLYPGSDVHPSAVEAAHKIIAKNRGYKDKKEELARIIDGDFAGGTSADRHYRYAAFLYGLGQSKLYDWSLIEFGDFVTRFKDDARNEEIQLWIADTYAAKGENEAAVASYLKYERLHPGSDKLPGVKYHRATLLSEKIKDFERATEVLTDVVDNHPASDHAAAAIYARARIKASKFKDYDGAIADYRRLVTDRPQHDQALEALLAIAALSADKLKAYRTAIGAYEEVVDNYPGDNRGIEALEESAKIYLNKLKDPLAAAAQYARIATQFPAYDGAAPALFKAAEICEKKLKEYNKAIEYYQLVTTMFPDSKLAGKAREKITRIVEKMDEG